MRYAFVLCNGNKKQKERRYQVLAKECGRTNYRDTRQQYLKTPEFLEESS